MPLLNDYAHPPEWMDPDLVPRPLVTFGAAGIAVDDIAAEHAANYAHGRKELGFHRHRKGELVLALHGILTCEVEGGLWVVPPQSALWIPCDVEHKVTATGTIECYIAFVTAEAASTLPPQCCAVTASPLLRELLIRAAGFPLLYPEGGLETHLATLLMDELATAKIGDLHLPMPTDRRLRKIADMLMEDPTAPGTMQTWARKVGLSERTLARLLTQQTGMSFGRWRQQLQVMLAVTWLGSGASVQQVADRLGYESTGSFVTMFRKALGTTPGRYMAQRSGTAAR
ncbi:helix-turn-helix transcriptional regulator [Paraburkholderia sp. D15]|uniref:AraC family transcriptional regulator n=1 Tax=Paraburkholderia sp. D15 TaxID=2880218 RepID=UPI002479A3CA|nr:helix-turn-helix transcriptional regulator [Paraburkholderia sp. D15]WGS50745.1 helix-turn-helix transcriptional regulator [Paraburkholderia sp. D15]WKF58669.1 HTH-type transcriptional regulator NimR [Paraburkholderia busanensis]